MKMTDYKRVLSKYTTEVLEQVRYIAEALSLRLNDKLTIPEQKSARVALQALTVSDERTNEILDLMRYDWDIFEGEHIRFSPSTNPPLSKALIRPQNLQNLIKATDALVEQRSPQRLKFSFDRKHILVQQGKKKSVVVGERDTYQEGLLKALTYPHVGVIKTVEAVLETVNECKALPKIADRKKFFRNQMAELQSKLKAVHLGGILTLKWGVGDRTLQLKAK